MSTVKRVAAVELVNFRQSVVKLLCHEHLDLTVRQLAVLLVCYTEAQPQTIRGLAVTLMTPYRSSITRAIDVLADRDLLVRRSDPKDYRSVFVVTTAKGQALMRRLQTTIRSTIPTTSVDDA